jgi:hypothetical protein
MPQSVLSTTRSGGRTLITLRIRSAACSGYSIIIVQMSRTPACIHRACASHHAWIRCQKAEKRDL